MPRACHVGTSMQQHIESTIKQTFSILGNIRTEQILRATVNDLISTVITLAARAIRAKEIVIAIAMVDIGSLHLVASYLYRLGTGLKRESVGTQLYTIDTMERAPEQILLTIILDIEGIDTVLYADILADKQCTMIGVRSLRLGGRSNT